MARKVQSLGPRCGGITEFEQHIYEFVVRWFYLRCDLSIRHGAIAGMEDVVTQDVQTSGTAAPADGAIIDTGEHVVVAQNTPLLARCFLAKPLSVVHAEESEGVLERSLGFRDLFALGFGGTVGRYVHL